MYVITVGFYLSVCSSEYTLFLGHRQILQDVCDFTLVHLKENQRGTIHWPGMCVFCSTCDCPLIHLDYLITVSE